MKMETCHFLTNINVTPRIVLNSPDILDVMENANEFLQRIKSDFVHSCPSEVNHQHGTNVHFLSVQPNNVSRERLYINMKNPTPALQTRSLEELPTSLFHSMVIIQRVHLSRKSHGTLLLLTTLAIKTNKIP